MKTKGTTVYIVREDSSGFDVIQIGCPTGVSGTGGSKPQVDDTCLDSDEMEFSPGMASPGAVNVGLNFDPAITSHRELVELFDNDNEFTVVIGMSDGAKTIAPTVDSSGTITFPSTRTFIEFRGYVADMPIDFVINQNVTSQVAIQRTGARTFHYKT